MNSKTIYFCHKTIDLMQNYPYNWKKLNPEYSIKLYDDKMCIKFLNDEFGTKYVDIFNYMENGAIKADFWRICILYKYGGFYSDVDNQPLVSIDDFLEENIDFIICCSFSPKFKFNPNFIGSKKGNPIVKKCIDWYIDKYDKKIPFEFWEYSIMTAFNDTLTLENFEKNDGIYFYKNVKIQILKEFLGKNHYDAHNVYNKKRVFNNRYKEWDCKTRTFKKDKTIELIPKGTNLNYYLFILFDLFTNLFTNNVKIDLILNYNNLETRKSLILNNINHILIRKDAKLSNLYNKIIKLNSEYVLIINSPKTLVCNVKNIIKEWKLKYNNNKLLFDRHIPISCKKITMSALFLFNKSNIIADRIYLIKILKKYHNMIQSKKLLNINKLLEEKEYKLNNNLFITNNIANVNDIIEYNTKFEKTMFNFEGVIIKLSFIISFILIWLLGLYI